MNKLQNLIAVLFSVVMLLVVLNIGCAVTPPPVPVDPVSPQGQLLAAVKGTNWLVTLSILGVAAGAFAFFNGNRLGIPVIVSCCIALFMALAVARFAMWMALFGMIGACVVVVISILTKNNALKEVVGNVQDIKKEVATTDPSLQDKLKDILLNQTKATQKLVSKIKKSLS